MTALVALLVLFAPAAATESKPRAARPAVQLPPTATGKVGQLVVIQADTEAEAVEWDVSEELAAEGEYYVDEANRRIVLPSPHEGKFWVRAWVASEGRAVRSAKCVVSIEPASGGVGQPGPAPAVVPTPAAPPAASPGPAASSRLHVTLVEDKSKRGQRGNETFEAIFKSSSLRKAIEAKGHAFWVKDVKDAEQIEGWADSALARAGQIPALVITDEAGNLRWARVLPQTEGEILKVVDQIERGK